MPLSTIEKSSYRSVDQVGKCYVWVVQPETAWDGQVNGTLSHGSMNIWFDNGVLDPTYAAEEHFTLLVGSTAGARDKGVVRYKSGAATGTGTLVLDKNEIEWADGDYLTLIQEVRPWAITPDLDGDLEDENKAYTDQNENMHPLTWVGPPAVGFLDSSYIDLDYWSSADLTHCGGSISSTAWTWYNGTEQGAHAGTALDPKPIRYTTTGNHFVKCTKTHSNTKTHARYTWSIVCARSGSGAPHTALAVSVSGSADMGSQATITVSEGADVDDFPDGACVVAFTEAWYGGLKLDFGGNWTHRENVKFVGWISGDTVKQNPFTGEVSFEAVAPTGITLACWPANIHDDGSAEWHRILNNTNARTMFHLISEHSTIDHLADVHLPTSTKVLRFVDVGEGTLWDQLRTQVGETIGAMVHFDSQGALYIEPDVQILPVADRAAIDDMFTVAATDWIDFDLGQEKAYTDEAQDDFAAFYYDASNDPKPWYSLAPGRQHSYGGIGRTRGVRADDQDEANELSGLYHARKNAEFQDCRMKMAGQWFCFDIAPQRFFSFPLDGTETERGLVWTGNNAKMVPRGYKLTWNAAGYFDVEVTFAQFVSGPEGAIGNYPDEPVAPGSPPAPPSPWNPLPPVSGGGEVVGVCGTGGFAWSANARSGQPPVWSLFNDGLGDADLGRGLCSDPYALRSQYGAIIDDAGDIYTSTDWRGVTAWSASLTSAEAKVLIDAATGESVRSVTFVDLKAFAATSTLTYLLAPVAYKFQLGGYELRVLRSSNWGASWSLGDRIPGYLTVDDAVEYSWLYNRKFDVGAGELAYDGTYLYIGAASRASWGIAPRSTFNYSPDWGATWQTAGVSGGGQDDATDTCGPACAKVDSQGQLYFVPWHPLVPGPEGFGGGTAECEGMGPDGCWDPPGPIPPPGDCPETVGLGVTLDPDIVYTPFMWCGTIAFESPNCGFATGSAYTLEGRKDGGGWVELMHNPACTGDDPCNDGGPIWNFDDVDELQITITGTTIQPSLVQALLTLTGGGFSDPFTEPVIASGGSPTSIEDLEAEESLATGDGYARYRGMFEILVSDEWVAAQIETPDSPNSTTKLYMDGVLKATLERPLRTIYAYPLDKMLIFFGRSWFPNEDATATYPELFYRSTTKLGAVPNDASGNLYALGMRNVANIIAYAGSTT